jgi:hypothetical protein
MRLLERAVGAECAEAGLGGVGVGHAQDELEARFAVRGDLRDEQRRPGLAAQLAGAVAGLEFDLVAQALEEPG